MKLAALVLSLTAATTSATNIYITNKCTEVQNLYDNSAITPMQPGATVTKTVAASGFNGMWRSGVSDRATLAEFSTDGTTLWYDISIIPPNPGSCMSHDECVKKSGGTGFNIAMQIAPRSNNNGNNCRTVTCMQDACDEAYNYPSDDAGAMADCPVATEMDVIFCPGGSGGTTTAPPTTTPTPTTTSTPTTTPTPTPTTTPTLTTTPVPTTTLVPTTAPVTTTEPVANVTAAVEEAVISETTTAVPATVATADTAAETVVEATSAVEVSTQSESTKSSGSSVMVAMVVIMGVAAVVGVAVVVVVRRKQAQLDELEAKSPMDQIERHHELSTVCML